MPGAHSLDNSAADSPVIAGMDRLTIVLKSSGPSSLLDRVERLADAVAAALVVRHMRLRPSLRAGEPGRKHPVESL